MFLPWNRLFVIVNLVFIQLFWTATSRGYNLRTFFLTFKQFRSLPIVFFGIACFLQALIPWQAAYSLGQLNGVVEWSGVAVALAGTALASWAKIMMGKSWGPSAQHDAKTQAGLVTGGPFAFSRNPIYVGLFLVFVGCQLVLRSYFIIFLIPFLLVIKKIIAVEEALLVKHFGAQYTSYAAKVRRFL